jgi:hypothetical protein
MIRSVAFAVSLLPAVAFAQESTNSRGTMRPGSHMMMGGSHMMSSAQGAGAPAQAGQDAFGAIQEIVEILSADPKTDWSKVDIDALRQHLVDMNNVVLLADVRTIPIEGGARFEATGSGAVEQSIRRMVHAHAQAMNGVDGWTFEAADIDGGASLVVRPPPKDARKLRGLGFFGVLALGMHHQAHHLMIARGQSPPG